MAISKNIPRLVIAAPQGRSGKTTITLGLLSALKKQGYRVQPFKKGPDYIDPSWLSAAAGRTCRNLDSFMLDDEDLKRSLIQATSDAHLAVVEGAMGFYDGMDLDGNGSTAEIAKKIEAPVLLVLDCQRMSRSAAAVVMGFQNFDPRVRIAGVILNNVSRPRHRARLAESIAKYCHIPVVGFLPRDGDLTIPGRHLGLMLAGESEELEDFFSRLTCLVEDNFDLSEILGIAGQAFPLEIKDTREPFSLVSQFPISIGVIRDQAFSFYYPENLEALERAGARICYLNSTKDTNLPELHGLLIGGGFPEVFASYSLKDMFFGNIPGSLGETSSLAILIGGIYLLIRRSADFRPVIATLLSFTILIIIAGCILYPNDVLKFTLYHLFTGGLLFGVFFMVTDPVTSPITRPGRFIFGLIIGALIFAIRMFGAYPEGVAMAILVANLFVPLIDYPKWATNQYTKKFFIGYALSFVCIILLSVWMLGGFGL